MDVERNSKEFKFTILSSESWVFPTVLSYCDVIEQDLTSYGKNNIFTCNFGNILFILISR